MKLPRRLVRLRRKIRRKGLRLHIRQRRYCEAHGKRVWVTTPATRSRRGRSVFCSVACKAIKTSPERSRERSHAKSVRPTCPRPDKRAFPTEAMCARAFRDLLTADPSLEVYLCRCGSWHAGHPHFAPFGRFDFRIEARIPPQVRAELARVRAAQDREGDGRRGSRTGGCDG